MYDFFGSAFDIVSCHQVIWQIIPPKNMADLYVFFAMALFGRVAIAYFLENDDDQDGDRYAQIASNVLEHPIILAIRILFSRYGYPFRADLCSPTGLSARQLEGMDLGLDVDLVVREPRRKIDELSASVPNQPCRSC